MSTISPELQSSYDVCRAITRSRARNFYYGIKLTPEPKRSAIYAVYAWMRLGDDLADDESQSIKHRKISLNSFKDQTEQLLAHEEPPDDPMWRAFAHTLHEFSLNPQDIRSMLDGLFFDMDNTSCETDNDLDTYCERVASTVGRVCLQIWGVRTGVSMETALELASLRGLAFQYTNILRDFAEDYDAGRVYLSRASFERAGLTPEQLRAWDDPDRCARFIRGIAGVARARYDEASPLGSMIHPSCAPAMWAMTRIYRSLLVRIEKAPEKIVLGPRVRLTGFEKASIAIRAAVVARRSRV